MKVVVNIARIIVGVLFIFSGLIKANDPAGLSYKMQEFFEVWGQYHALAGLMKFLSDYALAFSITTITLEVVVGVAILIGWRKKFFSWLLLLLIIFFTFLTGYAVLSGKIRTCGCFGDCIPLTAMQSFMKDIFLLVLVLIIFFGVKYINKLFEGFRNFFILMIGAMITLGFQWWVLKHLPLVDCLPFKPGNNILELRKMPADAVPDKVDFKFVYEKNGTKKDFAKTEIPDSTWTFVSREDIILEKGKNNEAPIKDFFLNTLSGADTTEAVLKTPGNYYLFFVKTLDEGTDHWLSQFTNLYRQASQKKMPIFVITSQETLANQFFNTTNNFQLPVLSCDVTALKTAARANPTLYLMNGPVVVHKWGYADIKKAIP